MYGRLFFFFFLLIPYLPLSIGITGLEFINHFSFSSAEHEISLLINMKMPTIVGIFIFTNRTYAPLCLAKNNLQLSVI